MIVMKFGGSSVKDAEALDRATSIVTGRLSQRPAVVVSAFGNTTDLLVSILDALSRGREQDARRIATTVADHHEQIIDRILTDHPLHTRALRVLDDGLARLHRLIDGMACLAEVSPRSRDAVLAFGELTAAPLLALFLSSRGLDAEAVDPVAIMITNGVHGAAVPLAAETTKRCRGVLMPLLEQGRIPVIGGFVGATQDGVITTLGRGGSDLTASMIAMTLKADGLEYWKDVDGILTADPRLVAVAASVPSLTFREAAELAFLGAKVLHPSSIQPAVDAGVPVRVRNSYHPSLPGTLIVPSSDSGSPKKERSTIASIACKRDQVLLNAYATRMLGASGFLRHVFEVFDQLDIPVDHIATSEVNITVTLGPSDRLERLKEALGEVAKVDVTSGVGVVSVVGERLAETPGVGSKIFGALQDINIQLVTYGGSGVNLSLVVRDEQVPEAVRRLHAAFFPGV